MTIVEQFPNGVTEKNQLESSAVYKDAWAQALVGTLNLGMMSTSYAEAAPQNLQKSSVRNLAYEFDVCSGLVDEILAGVKGSKYAGCQTRTISKKTCQNWSVQTPHTHNNQNVGNHNNCRNPAGGGNTIWCFTTAAGTRWEYCEPRCQVGKEELIGNKGEKYVGCQTRTKSGRSCQAWSVQTPHTHTNTNVGDHL